MVVLHHRYDIMSDSLKFLESVMAGNDPRELSEIYKLMEAIEDFCGEKIGKKEWQEVKELVEARYKFETVQLSQSILAGKTLAEYQYAKKKAIDINSMVNISETHGLSLTESEIDIFEKKFNNRF